MIKTRKFYGQNAARNALLLSEFYGQTAEIFAPTAHNAQLPVDVLSKKDSLRKNVILNEKILIPAHQKVSQAHRAWINETRRTRKQLGVFPPIKSPIRLKLQPPIRKIMNRRK